MEFVDQIDFFPEEGSETKEWYTPPYLAQILHELPHLNIFLQYVNDTIELDSNEYMESIGVFSSVFFIMLMMTLFVLAGSLVQSLFSTSYRPNFTIKSLRATLLAMLSIVLVFVVIGSWAEVAMHRAIESMIQEWSALSKRINNIAILAFHMHENFGDQYIKTFESWEGFVLDAGSQYIPVFAEIEYRRGEILNITRTISKPFIELKLEKLVMSMFRVESARASIGMAGWCGAVFLAMVGMIAATWPFIPRGLAVLAITALCGITGNYMAAAINSGVLVAISDACMDPYRFVSHHVSLYRDFNVFSHFLICDENENEEPPRFDIRQIKERIDELRVIVAKPIPQNFSTEDELGKNISMLINVTRFHLIWAERYYNELDRTSSCNETEQHFRNAVVHVCESAVPAALTSVMSYVASAIFFTIIVYIYITTKRLIIAACGDEKPACFYSCAPDASLPTPRKPFTNFKIFMRKLIGNQDINVKAELKTFVERFVRYILLLSNSQHTETVQHN